MTCCENTREKNHFIFKNQITFSSLPGGKSFYFGLKIELILLTCLLSSEISFLSSLSVCVCVHMEKHCLSRLAVSGWLILLFAQHSHALEGSVMLKIIYSLYLCLQDVYKYASMKRSHTETKQERRHTTRTREELTHMYF